MKETWLWVKNLPLLQPTDVLEYVIRNWTGITVRGSKDRSRTFQGIANAMAKQWGDW